MKSVEVLPQGYRERYKIDLQKDKKLALLVNLLGAAIMVIMVLIAVRFVPLRTFWAGGVGSLCGKWAVYLGGYVAYIILHEAVHGIVMRRFCRAKVKFGFTGLYAYAGSAGYYCRRHYIIIALAPVVVWGVVLAVLNAVVPLDWFYVVYFIQAGNIGGAAGDMYVTWRMMKMPKDILVQDMGISMTVYSREEGHDQSAQKPQ